jgi:hypothetical protein
MHTENRTRTHCWFQVRVVSSRNGWMFLVGLREDGKRFAVKLDDKEFGVTKTAAEWFDLGLLSLDHFLVWENDDTEYDHIGGGLSLEDQATLSIHDPWTANGVQWYLDRSPFKQAQQ